MTDATQTQREQAFERVTRETLHLALVRLGGRYERAALREPRDYDAMTGAERGLLALQERFEEANCGQMFRRGQNVVRRARGLEEVAAW